MWQVLTLQNRFSPMAKYMQRFLESAIHTICFFIAQIERPYMLSRCSAKLIRNNGSSGVYNLNVLIVTAIIFLLIYMLFYVKIYILFCAGICGNNMSVYMPIYFTLILRPPILRDIFSVNGQKFFYIELTFDTVLNAEEDCELSS